MLSSLYNGLSGLLAFSKGLDVLSNNVANMNTPGFKSSELAFRDLFYRFSANPGDGQQSGLLIGQGVNAESTSTNFRQGDLQDTGNPMDVALDGNGFFIIRKDDRTFYTRTGQLDFDDEGFLIERGSGGRVAGYNGSQLEDISITDRRAISAKPTSEINFAGVLSSGSTSHTVPDVAVFDSTGASHKFKFTFANNGSVTARSWLVEVRDENNAVIATASNLIRFNGDGSPEAGFNTISFTYTPSGASSTSVTLNFGDPGSVSGARHLSGGTTSDLKLTTQDGYAVGSATETSFNDKGELTVTYSNGQTETYERLAIASFTDLQALQLQGSSLFENTSNQKVTLGNATENGLGQIVAERVEGSNVELTEQFTDMVVIQRGYQASSQVISVTNEMIQQLLDLRGRR